MGYINRLENYDGVEIAQFALNDEYKMYDEGLAIYQKFGHNDLAMDVIIDKLKSIEQASEFATR